MTDRRLNTRRAEHSHRVRGWNPPDDGGDGDNDMKTRVEDDRGEAACGNTGGGGLSNDDGYDHDDDAN